MSFLVNAVKTFVLRQTGERLAMHGLTVHDAFAETGVFLKAISRLPQEMQEQRARRIQRAMDISSKHTPLPREQWEDPWREFEIVNKVLAQTQKEHDERLAMNNKWWMPYHIGRESWFPYDTKNAHFWKR